MKITHICTHGQTCAHTHTHSDRQTHTHTHIHTKHNTHVYTCELVFSIFPQAISISTALALSHTNLSLFLSASLDNNLWRLILQDYRKKRSGREETSTHHLLICFLPTQQAPHHRFLTADLCASLKHFPACVRMGVQMCVRVCVCVCVCLQTCMCIHFCLCDCVCVLVCVYVGKSVCVIV